jgi:hypothetical protein
LSAARRRAERKGEVPDDVLDQLYGAPPTEFVARRDAAARERKQAGDEAAARAMRALKRPAAPAAAINLAVRAEPAQARALLDTAGDLRRAHEAVVRGAADRDALRAAVAAERQAVTALAATAAAQAASGGTVSADMERRIRDTLEAVALDSEVRERFAVGRLEKDARAAGLAMDVAGAAAAPPRKRRDAGDGEAKRKAEQERRRLADALRRAEKAVARSRADVEAAEQARARADAALREARKRLRAAEAELRRARRAGP